MDVPNAGDALEGQIVGIESVEKVGPAGKSVEPHLALMADRGRLLRVPLLEVSELRFPDESVRRDVQSLLDILGASLRKDRKRLTIHAVGEGARRGTASVRWWKWTQ